jgi:hypothetical protein
LIKDEIICVTDGLEKMDITSHLAILKLRRGFLSLDDVKRLGCIGGIITLPAYALSSQSSGARHENLVEIHCASFATEGADSRARGSFDSQL